MTAVLLPNGKQQYFTSTGDPLVGGRVFTYDSGTLTPRTTWKDAGQLATNTNPVILDGRGEATIFWSGAYRVIVQDSLGNIVIPAIDGISDQNYVDVQLRTDLADATNAVKGADLVGFDASVAYTGATVGGFLATIYKRTAAEIAAGVTPTNYAYLDEPQRYGAVLDGSTDDTAALQRWLTVGGNRRWSTVATAKITAALTIPSNTTIYAANGATIRQYTANANVLAPSGVTNIRIQGLTLYAVGSMSSTFNGQGIFASGCTYIDVIDCVVTGHRGWGVMFYNSNHCECRFSRFLNSPVINSDTHNQVQGDIAIEGSSSYCKAIGNECISGNGVGIQCQSINPGDICSHNQIEANLITDCKIYGMMSYQLNNTDQLIGNSFVGNTVKNVTGAVAHQTLGYIFGNGFYGVGCDDLLVSANNIKNTHSGGVLFIDLLAPAAIGVTLCGKVSITSNIIRTDAMNGISVRDPSAVGPSVQQTIVANNNVSNITLIGIDVKEKANCKVDGNTIDTTGGNGIHFNNTTTLRPGNSANNNIIRNVTGTGLLAAFCVNFACNGNEVYTTSVHGIYILSCQDVVLTGNTVNLHTTYGIAIDTVTRYTMSGNAVNGTGASSFGYLLNSRATGLGAIDPTSNTVANCVTTYTGDYKPFYGANPTTGTWVQGDQVWELTPASAGYRMRICTVAGTPGTWKQWGLIT